MFTEITFENAQQALIESSLNQTVVVQFYSPSSPACEPISQQLAALAQQYPGQFALTRLNMDELAPLAAQLGVGQAPAILILQQGRPVDGTNDFSQATAVSDLIARHLPKPEDLALTAALGELEQGNVEAALTAARDAYSIDQQRSDIKFALIRALLENRKAEEAEQLLDSLPLEDQQADYQALRSQLELLQAAADSPEIRALEEQLAAAPDNLQLRLDLAIQYSQNGRNEEALESLFSMLKQNLDVLDGQVKKHFLDMLVTLNGEAIASTYRRQYYSLLY
ncbi:tetratricopeptide repeat protein [Aliagarivorans taiwanensis]|uniref:tetratricopeptide repeat protein n=1 Tax=Aliagarivorans taiwanensis TaxID=561966 RepID=UPI00041D87FB|nr:tetratricopeptide repeat protein [Aliagarivorans taiwanensis]